MAQDIRSPLSRLGNPFSQLLDSASKGCVVPEPDPRSPLLDTSAAAAYCGVSPRTFETWRTRGGGPRFTKIGRCVRYRTSDLDSFIEAGSRLKTSDIADVPAVDGE